MNKANMTPEEFKQKMEQAFDSNDIEMNHINADELMCELLESLGFEEGVKVFTQNAKWYA